MMAPVARAATTSDVFNAIAEPQRREILVLLRAGERPVTELVRELGMAQPRASKHLRVLREVGLVRDRKAGKQRRYCLAADGLRPVHEGTGGFERIALLHGESRGDPNAFELVLTFERQGAATWIEMRTVFSTKELRDEVVEKYHAIEGGQQTLSNLAAYLTEIVANGAGR